MGEPETILLAPCFPTLSVSLAPLLHSALILRANGHISSFDRLQCSNSRHFAHDVHYIRAFRNLAFPLGNVKDRPHESRDMVPQLADDLPHDRGQQLLDPHHLVDGGSHWTYRWRGFVTHRPMGLRSLRSNHYPGRDRAFVSWKLFQHRGFGAELLRAVHLCYYNSLLTTRPVPLPSIDVGCRGMRCRCALRKFCT